MRPEIDPRWVDYFRRSGFPSAHGLSSGMEGAVYSLVPDQLVAKVWLNKSEFDLQLLKVFYDALRSASRRIDTPNIQEIRIVDGALISIEQFLPGSLLQEILSDDAKHANPAAVKAIIEVLDFLRCVQPQPELSRLHVLDERVSPWTATGKWSDAIKTIIDRRLLRFGEQLQGAVPNLADIRNAVYVFLRTRDSAPMRLLHGDLCGANIMIDANASPLSVFDFGFLSTIGDPAFDASISSAIFNMYGQHARTMDDEVTQEISRNLGYAMHTLLSYRAVYALISSNAYSPHGTDGHYRWCVAMLNRPDIHTALSV